MKRSLAGFFAVVVLFLGLAATVGAQTTAFSYQGSLTDAGNPANGAFQMQFKMFDALSGGTQIGSTLTDLPVAVTNGVFSVKLDFGANALSGANRWLEIAVRHNSGESYVTLAPREQIASSPYAVRTLSAATADNALQLGGVAASEYVTNSNAGNSFVRNGTTLQTGNLNISGNGFFGGSVGVGTTAPTSTLEVNGTFRASRGVSNDVVVQTTGGTNAWARFWMISPSRAWVLGTSQNFNGNQFYLNDETSGQSRFTIQPSGGAISFPAGNTGFGTTNPLTKLDVRGDLTLENGTNPILYSSSAATEQNRYLLLLNSPSLQSASGLKAGGLLVSDSYLFANPGKNDLIVKGSVGIGTANPGAKVQISGTGPNGFSLGVEGSVTQNRDKGGFVKALVYLNGDGTIIRCFNSFNSSTSGGCGFTSGRASAGTSGFYFVDFGFPVNDRFWSLTVTSVTVGGAAVTASTAAFATNPQVLQLDVTDGNGNASDRPVMIVIY